MNLTKFFKGMTRDNITQIFHDGHLGLDIISTNFKYGYGTPLVTPERSLILGITDEKVTEDNKDLEKGYGVRFRGLETGHEYLYWHCLPIFPINGGDEVGRGQIIAYMGNSGRVTVGGNLVPLSERTTNPYHGTHLHIQMYKGRELIDPFPFINWNWEPQYGFADSITAQLKVLNKIAKLIK